MQTITDAGLLGLLALGLALVLAPVMLLARRGRGAALGVAALAPLLLGAAGTALGRQEIQRVTTATPGNADPASVEAAERQALASTWVGAAGTAPAASERAAASTPG